MGGVGGGWKRNEGYVCGGGLRGWVGVAHCAHCQGPETVTLRGANMLGDELVGD